MRFLANENFPLKSILLLRENGFEVISVSEEMAGAKDRAILELAVGALIVKPPTTYPWGRRAVWFLDPDGNIVNFYKVVK